MGGRRSRSPVEASWMIMFQTPAGIGEGDYSELYKSYNPAKFDRFRK